MVLRFHCNLRTNQTLSHKKRHHCHIDFEVNERTKKVANLSRRRIWSFFFIFRYIGKVAVAHVLCIWKWKTLMDFGRRRRRFHWKSVVCSLDVALCTVVVINTEGCQNLKFKKCFLLQLNKCETDPYFLQNFQCTTMFISAFCKICELNTEREIVFVLISVDSQGDITQV